jgi:hypothetical protein
MLTLHPRTVPFCPALKCNCPCPTASPHRRVITKVPTSATELPNWNYDGSSTGQVRGIWRGGGICPTTSSTRWFFYAHYALVPCWQARLAPPLPRFLTMSSTLQAPGEDSEVYLVPRALFKDPFRPGDNFLVMCDAYVPPSLLPDGSVSPLVPIPTNTRAACAEVMAKVSRQGTGHCVVLCVGLWVWEVFGAATFHFRCIRNPYEQHQTHAHPARLSLPTCTFDRTRTHTPLPQLLCSVRLRSRGLASSRSTPSSTQGPSGHLDGPPAATRALRDLITARQVSAGCRGAQLSPPHTPHTRESPPHPLTP